MKKIKWNRVLAVLLAMVTAVSLLSACGSKSAEKEDADTITVYLWSTSLYEKYAPYIQEQLPDINVEFVVGNNNLDFYSISVEIKETEDGYTLSKVIKKGKQIQDEDTFTVICLAIPKHMKTYPAEHEDPEKNYLEEIQVHEQQEWDSEYVHLKTEEKRWFHNIAICCEINGKKNILILIQTDCYRGIDRYITT